MSKKTVKHHMESYQVCPVKPTTRTGYIHWEEVKAGTT